MRIPVTAVTVFRLTALVAGGFAVAFLAPAQSDAVARAMQPSVAFFAAGTVLILLAEAMQRRMKLFEAVRLELTKLRRIYHISKNLSAENPKFRAWFTELHGYLTAYLSGFNGKSFDDYDDFNTSFRLVSYHVYTVPEIDTRKEDALFKDLLSTTAAVAEARQQIKELWDNRLSAYGWTTVLLVAIAFAASTLLASGDAMESRVAAGFAIAAMLVALDFLWEADTLSAEKKSIAKRYVDNVARLELGRRRQV